MTVLTPGAYIAACREQDGLTLEDVARVIDTEPHLSERERRAWLANIEADLAPISATSIAILARVIRFDPTTLQQFAHPANPIEGASA